MSKHPDVAVIGGGIIGLSTAYFLAKAGFTVDVLDRSDLGREASWAGAGIIPPGNPERAGSPADQLRAIGSARFPVFSAELRELTGVDNGYRACGGIEFLHPADEYVLPVWQAEGIVFERLTPDELSRLEPGVGAVPGEPYFLPSCAQVRNPWHLRALIAACQRAGVQLHPHQPVRQFECESGRVSGLNVGEGSLMRAGSYLLTAGAWSGPLLEQLGQVPVVQPVRGQIVLLYSGAPSLSRILMLGKEYLVPRGDGRVLVGSTEEPEAGFVKVNTEEAVTKLRRLAAHLVPTLADARVETCWAGLRPGSPDGLPYLGNVPGWENVFVAAGHFRAGVQLSIGTAQVITELFQGRPTTVPLDAFRLDRTPCTPTQPAFRS
jgi:glycine oxidase